MDTIPPSPRLDQKYGPRLFPHLASRIHRVHYGLLDEVRKPKTSGGPGCFGATPCFVYEGVGGL